MKVFIDTNVLISAFITRGLCAEIVEDLIARHHLMTGQLVLDEFEHVLKRKFTFDQDLIDLTIEYLQKFNIAAAPTNHLPFDGLDEMDALILTSAIHANAEYFVTGDSDFLMLAKETTELKIVSPREFWMILQTI